LETTLKAATVSIVDHVTQHSSVDNMIPPPTLETASDAHLLTPKGNYQRRII